MAKISQFTHQPSESYIAQKLAFGLFNRAAGTIYSHLFFATMLIWLLWGKVDFTALLVWGSLIYTNIAFRAFHIWKWLKSDNVWRSKPWIRTMGSMTSLVNGALWASTTLFLDFDLHPYESVAINAMVIGLSAGAAVFAAFFLPAFYLAVVPYLGSYILFYLLQFTPESMAVAFILFVFGLMLFGQAKQLNRVYRNDIILQSHNEHLIDSLEEKTAKAEAAVVARTRFLAAASHDLRQPTQAMSLLSYAMEQKAQSEDEKHIAKELSMVTEQLNQLLDGILNLSKLDAEATKPAMQEVDLSELLNRLYREFFPQFQHKELRFDIKNVKAIVRTDPILLTTLVRNLLSNALKYTPHGGVLFSARLRKQHVLIQVWDTGVGIAPQHVSHIFEEFFQLNNDQRNLSQGLGLGLAICQRIALLLNTHIQVQSRLGHGSVFSISLPLVQTLKYSLPEAEIQRYDFGGKLVLLLDDHPPVVHALKKVLSLQNLRVEGFYKLRDAQDFLQNQRVDLVISDHRLAGEESGAQWLNILKNLQNTPGILLTGESSPDVLRHLHSMDIPVISKPVEVYELLARIDNLLNPKTDSA